MEANSSPVLETLQTLIAPGNQVRISPYIESVQFKLLFNKEPDPNRRYESAKSILDGNIKKVQDLAHIWVEFDNDGKEFQPEIYTKDFLDAYLAYYTTVNIGKLQLLLLDLLRNRSLPRTLNILDIGVATGTTFLAVVDFMAAWESACLIHNASLPISSLRLIGVDARRDCLDYSKKATEYLANLIQESGASRLPFINWTVDSEWIECDIRNEELKVPNDPTIFVCSNVLSEKGIENRGHDNIFKAIGKLPLNSLILLLEPGDRYRAKQLNTWRAKLLKSYRDLQILGPCGMEYDQVPDHCAGCWNVRRESLHRPLLYQYFCNEAEKLSKNKNHKWQEEYENNLLSWSYFGCVKQKEAKNRNTISWSNEFIHTRYIGRFRSYDDKIYSPAPFFESNSPVNEVDIPSYERIKFCPAVCGNNYSSFTLKRESGFIMPYIRFGQEVALEDVKRVKTPYELEYHFKSKAVSTEPSAINSSYITEYTDSTRSGIDAISHRLFGFPGMRGFQHQILARVLTGKSIFAIAATGGGKSECFILPAMLLPGLTVVISPLLSLMQDQYDQRICSRFGLGTISTYINSSIPYREREIRIRRMELGYYKLVYLTPEQCSKSGMLASLRRANEKIGFKYLALDEAHCISHWGHDFRPAYLNLLSKIRQEGLNPIRIALTATASPQVRQDICDELGLDPRPIEQGGDLLVYSANRPELNFIVKQTNSIPEKVHDIEYRLRRLLQDNKNNEIPGAAIVFMPHTGPSFVSRMNYEGKEINYSTRRTVAHFASHLERSLGKRVGIYHGQMDGPDDHLLNSDYFWDDLKEEDQSNIPLGDIKGRVRRREQEQFIKGATPIMVATKGFGMGIDKPNIRLVLHHTTPANLEAYTQEAGRAGRDGQFADVVLYFCPDAGSFSTEKLTSDFEVQQFFLNQKYIRKEDIFAIWGFLRSFLQNTKAIHYPGKTYFTADEVLGYFNSLVRETKYIWPEFPPRNINSNESREHGDILNKGHWYQQKINYIDRILSTCYRIRPIIQGKPLSLINEIATGIGTEIVGGRVINPQGILSSNDRFAEIFRNKKLTIYELNALLNENKSLFNIALRLNLSLQDSANLLQDVKKSDGAWTIVFGKKTWKSHLLEFKSITTPKRGPALGNETLNLWRQYAGAICRASKKEAYDRAMRAGRVGNPQTDDWFNWKEVSKTTGWEVTLGDLFTEPEKLKQYIQAFMFLHDKRREEDNGAYQLLLRDYIGVSETGRSLPHNGGCLRVVLLGYLKTNETVIDGKCGGCSICCPDEKFQLDLDWRRSRIVSLSETLSQYLKHFETQISTVVPQTEIESFWQLVSADELAGRAVIGYLRGWTNRLISETPSHISAFWLRADGTIRNRFPLMENDLLHDFEQLSALITEKVTLERLTDMVSQSSGLVVSQKAKYELIFARLLKRIARVVDEKEAWRRFLSYRPQRDQALEANLALVALHAVDGPLPNPRFHRRAAAAALELDSTQAIVSLKEYFSSWTFSGLLALLTKIEPSIISNLFDVWFDSQDKMTSLGILESVLSSLAVNNSRLLSKEINEQIQSCVLNRLEAYSKYDEEFHFILCRMEALITCQLSRWYKFAASYFDKLGYEIIADELWLAWENNQLLHSQRKQQHEINSETAERLARLYSKNGNFPDDRKFRHMVIAALHKKPYRAEKLILQYISDWSFRDLCSILIKVPESLCSTVIEAWFVNNTIEIESFLHDLQVMLSRQIGLSNYPKIVSKILCSFFEHLFKENNNLIRKNSRLDLESLFSLLEEWLSDECQLKRSNAHDLFWRLLEQIHNKGAIAIGRMTARVSGGVNTELGCIHAFLPCEASEYRDYAELTNKKIEFKIKQIPSNPRARVLLICPDNTLD